VKKFIASIVYTHLWIAICAASMVLQTFFLFQEEWQLQPLVLLTTGSTLLIYAIHRLVGLQKLKNIKASLNPRYLIIDRDQRIVFGFGIIGGIVSLIALCYLNSRETILWLIIPGLISLAYVIPFLSKNQRLRDLGTIKIFLIALSYAYVLTALPASEMSLPFKSNMLLLFIEKGLFIFAITIPFDIRDLSVDAVSGTETIPKLLGWQKSIRLAQLLILISMVLVFLNPIYDVLIYQISMWISYTITIYYIQLTNLQRKDLFYSFGMDGLMILQTFLLLIASLI